MSCPNLHIVDQSYCTLASRLAGVGELVPITDEACGACCASSCPQSINKVTAGTALSFVKDSRPEHFESTERALLPLIVGDGSLAHLGVSFAKSTAAWIAAGSPSRSDEEVAQIFSICESCPMFGSSGEGCGTCKACGCVVSRDGGALNKIRRSTERCPIGKWQGQK